MFKLQNIMKFKKSNVKKMAENAVRNQKQQIAAGKDHKNANFTQYSRVYANAKKGGQRSPVTLKDTGKMLNAFGVQRIVVKKNQEIQFLYGIKKNKQGTKLFNHNQGEEGMPKRSIAENQELGDKVEEGIVRDFANIIGKNLSRMSKTRVKIHI